MKKTLSIALSCLVALLALWVLALPKAGLSSEPPETEWSTTYGGSGTEQARYMIQTNDGGYALVGYNVEWVQTREGGRDFWLVKADEGGNMEWSLTVAGYIAAYSEPLVQAADGGYVITGSNYSDSGSYTLWLAKIDVFGDIKWSQPYGVGGDFCGAGSVVRTLDGGYMIAAKKGSFYAGEQDVWLIKTDADGNEQWNKTYGGQNNDIQYSLIQTRDGGYAVAGATDSYGAGNYDAWLLKINSSGIEEWNATYGGTNGENALSLTQTRDGDYVLAGYKELHDVGRMTDCWLVKADADGNHLWNKTYGGTNSEHAHSVVQTGDGGYALACNTKSIGAGSYDAWLVRTDASGNMLWNQTYGATEWDSAQTVVQTEYCGYALAGHTNSFGAGSYDFWLIKLAPECIPAAVDIDPDTLNLKSNGQWITAYISLPEEYNVEDIIPDTVNLWGISAAWAETQDSVYMAKFDRATVQTAVTNEPDYDSAPKFYDITLFVTGELADGTPFEGSDTITVLKK